MNNPPANAIDGQFAGPRWGKFDPVAQAVERATMALQALRSDANADVGKYLK